MKKAVFLFSLLLISSSIFSQTVLKEVLKANREKLYRNIVRNTINGNLGLTLTDSTEDNWQDAFSALELINFSSPWVNNKIHIAFNEIAKRSIPFQRSLLELGYTNYPGIFNIQVKSLLLQTADPKIFALCTVYILKTDSAGITVGFVQELLAKQMKYNAKDPILLQLNYQLENWGKAFITPSIHTLFKKDYLPGQVLLISIQRKNRDYPGIVLVRDRSGDFVKDYTGNIFSVAQLARSINNLPGYLTNGNTPEGIFRMGGFDQSKSQFIGPTANIQLSMPFEKLPSAFYNNPSSEDSTWPVEQYKKLLPENFRNYFPALQSYYAGKAGRTEIIAHGTTVDPAYYKGKPYYPLTPTLGCLCTKEIWNDSTGRIKTSDQQLLSNAVMKGGGAYGYAIVINIDDKEAPVTMDDILPFLKLAEQIQAL